jgi:hypothetical protein
VVRAVFVGRRPLVDPEELDRFLGVLDQSEAFAPQRWGLEEPADRPYDRAAVIAEVAASQHPFEVCSFGRTDRPIYRGYFRAQVLGLQFVEIVFRRAFRADDLARMFELGQTLAATMQADFGMVQPVWRLGAAGPMANAAANVRLPEIQRYGLRPLGLRTWLGPHLAGLIGPSLLEESQAVLEPQPWGGFRVDLMDDPWTADFATFSDRQAEVMAVLLTSRVFGDYRTPIFRSRTAERWEPLPDL